MNKLLNIAVLLTMAAALSCAGTSQTSGGDEVTAGILDSAVSYIKANHPGAAPYLPGDISFAAAGSTGKDVEGYTGVTYKGGGWTVSIGHAIVPHYIWDIKADYGNGRIVWTGTSSDGKITEESYTAAD